MKCIILSRTVIIDVIARNKNVVAQRSNKVSINRFFPCPTKGLFTYHRNNCYITKMSCFIKKWGHTFNKIKIAKHSFQFQKYFIKVYNQSFIYRFLFLLAKDLFLDIHVINQVNLQWCLNQLIQFDWLQAQVLLICYFWKLLLSLG